MFENHRRTDEGGDEVVQRHPDARKVKEFGDPRRLQLTHAGFLVQIADQFQLLFGQFSGHGFGDGLIGDFLLVERLVLVVHCFISLFC